MALQPLEDLGFPLRKYFCVVEFGYIECPQVETKVFLGSEEQNFILFRGLFFQAWDSLERFRTQSLKYLPKDHLLKFEKHFNEFLVFL